MKTRYVVGFLFDNATNEVVLIKKNRPEWQKNRFNGVGGHCEEGEAAWDAMVREFQEETNVIVLGWEHVCTIDGDDGGNHAYELFVYRAFSDDKLDEVIEEKERGFKIAEGIITICETQELPQHVLSNVNWLIPMCIHSCTYGEKGSGYGMPFLIQESGVYQSA